MAASCAREDADISVVTAQERTVPVILSLSSPVTLNAATKSTPGMEMGVNPAIKTIHVAVFGSSGYLQEYVSATPCDAGGRPLSGFTNANGTTAYFLVRLSVRPKQSQIHIIANGPSSLSYNAYENTLMQGLRTTDGNGAYWTRLNLPSGIRAKMVTNSEGEEVYLEDANGELVPTDETVAAFSNIVLVRNFAGITVRERQDVEGGVPNFDLIGFTVCNMPKEGAVAMYSSTHDCWVENYEAKCVVAADQYSDGFSRETGLISWNGIVYPGFPANPLLNTDDIPDTEAEFNAGGVASGPGETKFIYERAVTSGAAPFVLLAGRYVSEGKPTSATPVQYYRLDITKNDNYVPFYRNINYYITLTGVSVEGYSTPAEASKHNSGDNFSISLDTSTLPDVSNGAIRMLVETTSVDAIYSAGTKSVWFQFETTDATPQYMNSNVTVSVLDGGNAINLGTTTYSGNYGYVNFTFNEPTGDEVLTSVIKLVGEYEEAGATSKLSREITVRVFNKQDMSLSLNPDTIAPLAGEETSLTISIPKTLSWSMFPMEFSIEDSAKSLNPSTDGIPVRSGVNSIVEGRTSEPSYNFVYTLNWSDYNELLTRAERAGDTGSTVSFNVVLKSIKASSSTRIYVANNYFNTENVDLSNDSTNMVTPSTQTISGTTATVQITSSDAWALSIVRSNGSAASGVTLSEYSIGYTLTLTNTVTGVTRRAVIVQEGKNVELDYYNNTRTVAAAGSNTFYVNVTSEVDYTLSVLDHSGNVLGTPVSGTANATTQRKTIAIPENDLVSDRNLTIRLSNATGSITRDLIVTQYASTAALNIVDTEILASQTTATVNVTSTIATVLNVYDASYNLISSTNVAAAAGGRNVVVNLTANNTGADRSFRVELCNTTTGTVLRTASIIQYGPTLLLSTNNAHVSAATTTAVVNVYADMNWTLTLSGGSSSATLSTYSGSATGTSGTNVTLTMPANTDPEHTVGYTIVAESSDGTIVRTVNVTQHYAPVNVSMNTRNSTGSVSGGTYTGTSGGLTVTMTDATGNANYITVDDGGVITVSVPSGYRIETITVNRTSRTRQLGYNGSDGTFSQGGTGNGTTANDTWTANSSANVNSVQFNVDNSGGLSLSRYFRANSVTVTYIKI